MVVQVIVTEYTNIQIVAKLWIAGLAAPAFGRPGNTAFDGQQSGFGTGSQQGAFGNGNHQSGFGSGAQQGGFSGASSSSQSSFSGAAQQGSYPSGGSSHGGFGGAQQSGPQQPPIAILSYENVNNGDGSYRFSYETENGIKAQEQGELKNKGSENAIQTVSGSYSYTGESDNKTLELVPTYVYANRVC